VVKREGDYRGLEVRIPHSNPDPRFVTAMAEDRNGNLWFGTANRLVRRRPDGSMMSWGAETVPVAQPRVMLQDREGRLWVGGGLGLGFEVLDISGERPASRAHIATPWVDVLDLYQDDRGDFWAAGAVPARLEFDSQGLAGAHWHKYPPSALQGARNITSIAGDTLGNLWLGVNNLGVARMLRPGFSTFTESDGLTSQTVVSIFEDRDGALYAMTDRHVLNRFDGQRFMPIVPRVPAGITDFGWGEGSVVLQDRRGEWWMATAQGLLRYPHVHEPAELASTAPKGIYKTPDGLASDAVLQVMEDASGIWVGLLHGLARWDAATQRFENLTGALGAVAGQNPTPVAFAQDSTGQVWIGLDYGGVVRRRRDRLEHVDGTPAGSISSLFVDRQNRLWIASTRGGLGRIDDPAASPPVLRRYTTAEGLSSNQIFGVAEDHSGRIYIAGGQGVDRLEPDSGLVQHYLMSDGIPPGEIDHVFCDRSGAMWFGSDAGLARREPDPPQSSRPPAPLIHSVEIAGVPALLSDDGESAVEGLKLPPGKDDVEIAFGAVDFTVSHGPRYQYRLLGVDQEWRKPTTARSVRYARLSSGHYSFQVRGINGAGQTSDGLASVAFEIPAPLWQRWWFVMSTALGIAALAWSAHLYRLRHIQKVQQIRARLAADLHDDLGAGLAQIAILAEVAKRQDKAEEAGNLETIAARARELRSTMGDIVWSVDPARDNLTDLIRRWRQTAFGLLASGEDLAFFAPPESDTDGITLLPDRRRHLLLLFKEAIANLARHARADRVSISVTLNGGKLRLRVEDDGNGFSVDAPRDGKGLTTMAHRARRVAWSTPSGLCRYSTGLAPARNRTPW
jgi:ligand-binding sensor domain-containing protein/signal transduction histidine kinase